MVRTIWLKLRSLWQRTAVKQDIDEELRFHLEQRTAENIAAGMTPEEAAREARKRFGNFQAVREECRETRGASFGEATVQDIRFGLRMLLKSPGFTSVAVLTLALGIGVNAGVFTVINGLLLRARVDKDPDSFVHLSPQYAGQVEPAGLAGSISLDDYRAYQAGAHSVANLAAWDITRVKLGEDANSELALLVTRDFFSLYGLEQPKLGRLFLAEECATPGAAAVVILSEELWRDRFGADPQIIGASINLNRRPFTVVGITPARFSGRLRGRGIWIPYTMQPQVSEWKKNLFQETGTPWLMVDGRIRAGQSRSAAQAELEVIARQHDGLQPGRQAKMILTNGSLIEEPTLRARVFWVPPLIMAVVSLVLLLTCVNVTLLLLARAAARQREMGIRLALGAGRRRLLRMLLTESLILAVAAGAVSAYLASQVPVIFEKTFVEAPNYPLKPDWLVFTYLAGVTLLAGCLAGLAPALESLKVNLVASLNGHESLFGGSAARWRARDLLVAAQVTISAVLLVVAGLFARAQYTMFTAEPGFETRQVLIATLEMERSRYPADAATAFYSVLEQRVRALPGVQAACYAGSPPGSGGDLDMALEEARLPGQAKGTGKAAAVNSVSADFFDTFRIPIVAGRTFHESEATAQSAAPVIVVSETLARTFWPDEDALGRVIVDTKGNQLRVVGIARDTRSGFGAVEAPRFYRLWNPQASGYPLMVRFVGEARPVAEAMRNVIKDLDHEMTIQPRTLRALLDEAASRFWVLVRLILVLGVVAVLLTVIGVYGVVAFAASRRTKEMGIRMALGATSGDIMQLMLRSGARPILAGLVTGLILAVAAGQVTSQVLRDMPFALTSNPLVYIAVLVLLASAAVVAMFGPARRAARVNPMVALRCE